METNIENKEAEARKEKLNSLFKNFKGSLLVSALILVLIIRLYFFFMTQGQPLWWDESEYMSGAKAYAGIVDYNLSSIRSPGFSVLASVFFILGIDSEFMLRFFLTLLPSLVVLLLTYFVTKEMYGDKKIAIISMLIMTFIWEHIFYSNRFHTENLSLIFQYLAIFVLFKGYIKKEKIGFVSSKYSLLLLAIFSIIALLFRPGNVVFLPAIVLFLPLVNFKFLKTHKNKTYIAAIILFITGILLLFNLSKIPFVSSYYQTDVPVSFASLSVFYGFYQPSLMINGLLFYFFIIGVIVSLVLLWIKLPLIKEFERNNDKVDFKADLFNMLLILSVLFSFIFLLRVSSFEYRWFFPLTIAMLAFTSKGILKISEYLKNISKEAPAIFIIIILALSLYGQFDHTKSLVESKLTSYQQVKDAGIWMKQNSNKEDIIVSASAPQTTYYSERETFGFSLGGEAILDEEQFGKEILKVKPRYLEISGFEPAFTPEWAYAWPSNNQNMTTPVQVYYADVEKKQPILVIYELRYE